MAEKTANIRIVKKKKGHAGHHGGAWKVAYADFVTAMMAFFLVMWIVGLSNPVKQAVAGYFKDPTGFMKAFKEGNAPFEVGKESGALKENENKPLPPVNPTQERARLEAAKKAIEKAIMQKPEFKEIGKHVDVKLVSEGLRIDLLESKESMFFDSGSAQVKPATIKLLTQIAAELRSLPNKLIIEGHTDSRPLNRLDGYTNWELSADRANSARHVVESAGVHDTQIAQVRGYAATQPRDSSNPASFINRRVSIVVVMSNALKGQQFGDSHHGGVNKRLPVKQSPATVSASPLR